LEAGATLPFERIDLAEVAAKFSAEAESSSFLRTLGVRSSAVDRGSASFTVEIKEMHARTMGIAHGGLVATLLDSALGCASWTLAPAGHHVVTVQLNINYIRPGWIGEILTATGEVRHAGQMTSVARGEVRTQQNALVASASGTFM